MSCQCSTSSSLKSTLSRSLRSSNRSSSSPSTAPLLALHRSFATSSRAAAARQAGEVDESILVEKKDTRATLYKAWLASPASEKYRRPTPGRSNWLGGDVPYPDNPSFKPQPPLSSATRNEIFSLYELGLTGIPPGSKPTDSAIQRQEPQAEGQVLRKISASYGLSLDRVRAIVRLVATEREIAQGGRALQTNFSKGMESYLGVSRSLERQRLDPPKEDRSKLTKKIWEYINEEDGEKTVLPAFLASRPPNTTKLRSLVGLGSYGPPPVTGYPFQIPEDGPPAPHEASRLKIIDVSKTPLGDALTKTWRNVNKAGPRSDRKRRAREKREEEEARNVRENEGVRRGTEERRTAKEADREGETEGEGNGRPERDEPAPMQ